MFCISFRAVLSFALAVALSGLAWAHTESPLAKLAPPHGGLVAAAGAYHVELVLKPDRVELNRALEGLGYRLEEQA